MKAFLLAAGFGERLRPLTDRIPKPLAPVLNVPAVCYLLTLLKEAGVSEIVCNVHHHKDMILEFFKQNRNFGARIEFSVEESILGTGGGLMHCRSFFEEGPFLYVNSDIIADMDLAGLIKHQRDSNMSGVCAVAPSNRGTIAVQEDRIVNIRNLLPAAEKPSFDFIGAAVLSPDIFAHLDENFSDIVETGFRRLAERGGLGYYIYPGEWDDIGTIESFRLTNINLLAMDYARRQRIYRATGLCPEAVAGTAVVAGGVRVTRSVIGDGCVIGEDAVIEESVVLPGARVANGKSVIRTVVGG
jgi:mannose-1-phosphate guanylyltransferase